MAASPGTSRDGIRELLATLTGARATLAVATSKAEQFAVRVLEHTGLRRFFASVHGATLDGAVRHKDQVVGAALAAHPDGERPVVVGDREHDVLGAARTGCCASAPARGRPLDHRRPRSDAAYPGTACRVKDSWSMTRPVRESCD